MTKSGQDDSRRSRWIWEADDVIIIKKDDLQPEKAPEKVDDNTPAADKAHGGIPTQGKESKKG